MHISFKKDADLFKASKNFRELLETIIKKKHKKPLKEDYESPSWPYYQADTNGYNRAVQAILALLKD